MKIKLKKKMKESKYKKVDEIICVICKNIFEGFGNNPNPISTTGRCCDNCNYDVIIERINKSYDKKSL